MSPAPSFVTSTRAPSTATLMDQSGAQEWATAARYMKNQMPTDNLSHLVQDQAGFDGSLMHPYLSAAPEVPSETWQWLPTGVDNHFTIQQAALAQQHNEHILQQLLEREQVPALQMVPIQLVPVPIVLYEAQSLQEQHARTDYVRSIQCIQMDQDMNAQVEEPSETDLPQQQGEDHAESKDSTSARRRMRRRRAELRRREAALTAGLPAAASSLSCSKASGSCQELMDDLAAGSKAREEALAILHGSVWSHSRAPSGCRLVQLALQVANRETASDILEELHGHVKDAIDCPHANYVIQKVVEVMPAALSGFVIAELQGAAVETARHRFGCRILCRLLEHSNTSVPLAKLIDELLVEAKMLIRHNYAHYVMQSVLEHGLPEHKRQLLGVLCEDLADNAQHRCASHVIEAALSHCSSEDQCSLAAQLIGEGEDILVSLAMTQFGSFVVRALFRLPDESSQTAWHHIHRAAPRLQENKYGQRLLKDLGLKETGARKSPHFK